MKKLLVLLSLFVGKLCLAQTPATDPSWSSSTSIGGWEDDFTTQDTSSFDAGWVREQLADRMDEPQIFMKRNATLNSTDGLVLKAQQEEITGCGGCTIPDHHYSSACVISYKGVSGHDRLVHYGYIEAVVKINDTYGLWPAFWLWTEANCNGEPAPAGSACGGGTAISDYEEIDIFELIPGQTEANASSEFYGVLHNRNLITTNMLTAAPGAGAPTGTYYKPLAINDYTQAHKYAIGWSPTRIIWYIDDVAVRDEPNPGLTQKTSIIFGLGMSYYVKYPSYYVPYDVVSPPLTNNFPEYFDSDLNSYSPDDINTNPSYMKITDVKYYKMQNSACPATAVINTSTINWSTYTYNVKKSITIGAGTNAVPTAPSTPPELSNRTLRATDFIQLNDDFTVPIGSELLLEVNPCY